MLLNFLFRRGYAKRRDDFWYGAEYANVHSLRCKQIDMSTAGQVKSIFLISWISMTSRRVFELANKIRKIRQNENKKEFVAFLRKCSDIPHAFIKSLARSLSDEVKETATHIFFKRLPIS